MDEEQLKVVASQLRKPHGEYGVQAGEKMNEGNQLINLTAIDVLEPEKGDNILEIGMGNGFFVKNILSASSEIKYTGCDLSELMVEEARKRNKKFIESGQGTFYAGNADKLPFADRIFNKVLSINTIYFWENHKLVLSEIRRVLKPGGKIIIGIRPKSTMQHYPFVKYGFVMFSEEELVALLSQNQFTVAHIIRKEEPAQEISGEKFKVESLIVNAEKTN